MYFRPCRDLIMSTPATSPFNDFAEAIFRGRSRSQGRIHDGSRRCTVEFALHSRSRAAGWRPKGRRGSDVAFPLVATSGAVRFLRARRWAVVDYDETSVSRCAEREGRAIERFGCFSGRAQPDEQMLLETPKSCSAVASARVASNLWQVWSDRRGGAVLSTGRRWIAAVRQKRYCFLVFEGFFVSPVLAPSRAAALPHRLRQSLAIFHAPPGETMSPRGLSLTKVHSSVAIAAANPRAETRRISRAQDSPVSWVISWASSRRGFSARRRVGVRSGRTSSRGRRCSVRTKRDLGPARDSRALALARQPPAARRKRPEARAGQQARRPGAARRRDGTPEGRAPRSRGGTAARRRETPAPAQLPGVSSGAGRGRTGGRLRPRFGAHASKGSLEGFPDTGRPVAGHV